MLSEDRCQAMNSNDQRGRAGQRCPNRHTDGKLCTLHQKVGAVIPDEWTPTNLPVFYLPLRVNAS